MKWHYKAHTVWHCRAAFSAVSFCNVVAKTVEKRTNIDRLIVPTTKRSVGRRHYMAHPVCADDQAKRWEKALHGTHCVALGEGTIRHTLCGVGRRHYKAHPVCVWISQIAAGRFREKDRLYAKKEVLFFCFRV